MFPLFIQGTNLAALISYAKEPGSCAQIVLVISNKSGVEELRNAARAGIPTRVKTPVSFSFYHHLTATESVGLYEVLGKHSCFAFL